MANSDTIKRNTTSKADRSVSEFDLIKKSCARHCREAHLKAHLNHFIDSLGHARLLSTVDVISSQQSSLTRITLTENAFCVFVHCLSQMNTPTPPPPIAVADAPHPSPSSLLIPPIQTFLQSAMMRLPKPPSNAFLIFLIVILIITVLWLCIFPFVSRNVFQSAASMIGVGNVRARRALSELRRKSFHLMGLLIPVTYYFGLKYTRIFTQDTATFILSTLFIILCFVETLRFISPTFLSAYNSVFRALLRKTEKDEKSVRLTGTVYFLLGHLVTIYAFPPSIAIASSLYLVLGDLTAAIIGISFGRIKVGRKSIEGSFAMFLVCMAISAIMFSDIYLFEYVCIVGSSIATIVELSGDEWLNDNLTIPICSAIGLQLAFMRIGVLPTLITSI